MVTSSMARALLLVAAAALSCACGTPGGSTPAPRPTTTATEPGRDAPKPWDPRFEDHSPTSACPLLLDTDGDGHDDLLVTQSRRGRPSQQVGPYTRRYDRSPGDDPFIVLALHTEDRSLRWEREFGTREERGALRLYRLGDGLLTVQDNVVRLLDPTDFETRWEYFADERVEDLAVTEGGRRLWVDVLHYLDPDDGEVHGQRLRGSPIPPPRGRLTRPSPAPPDPDLERLVSDTGDVGRPRDRFAISMPTESSLGFEGEPRYHPLEVHSGPRERTVLGVNPAPDPRRVAVVREVDGGDHLWLIAWTDGDVFPRWRAKLGLSMTDEGMERRAPATDPYLRSVVWLDDALLVSVLLERPRELQQPAGVELRRYSLSDGELQWSQPTTWTGCVSVGRDLVVAGDIHRLSDGTSALELPWRH